MKTVVITVVGWWVYRYIGVLLFKIRGAQRGRNENDSDVSFPEPPNIVSFFLWQLFGKRFLSYGEWRPKCGTWFCYAGLEMRKRILEEYREVYLWPIAEVKRLYNKYHRKIRCEYHTIRRTADKKLLKKVLFAELAQSTKKITRAKLVGVRSCTTGRPDWGWSTTYDLLIRLPKKRMDALSPTEFVQQEEWAQQKMDARLRVPSPKSREIILTIRGYVFQNNNMATWRNNYFLFLRNLAG